MHGGSGVSDEDYKKAIKLGVKKVNYYSYMAREGVYATRELLQEDITFFHDIALAATTKMELDVERAIKKFLCK